MDKDKAFISNKLTGEKLFPISVPDEGVLFKDEDGYKVNIDYWEDWSNTDCEEF